MDKYIATMRYFFSTQICLALLGQKFEEIGWQSEKLGWKNLEMQEVNKD
jgi:hypothetical protein